MMLGICVILLAVGATTYGWYRSDLRRLARDYACKEPFDGALERCIVRFPLGEAVSRLTSQRAEITISTGVKRMSFPTLGSWIVWMMVPMVAAAAAWAWQQPGYRVPLGLTAHIQNFGDQFAPEGSWVGTKGRSLRLEGFQMSFREPRVPGLSVAYMCHIQDMGDSGWMPEGSFCGTRGQSRRLEAVALRLVGPNADRFTIRYSCHLEGIGDIGPISDGGVCGTRGQSRRLEALLVEVIAR